MQGASGYHPHSIAVVNPFDCRNGDQCRRGPYAPSGRRRTTVLRRHHGRLGGTNLASGAGPDDY